ncbi:unnamed protein product [Rodentolepis nana]|uniref:MH2 domain-containing protein n=1 Tax=Rodentolepis nana TaxID=102285 RepID=A0A0R3T4W1_RODNA|nr:unnamed protein product [Rodentolepis nana]
MSNGAEVCAAPESEDAIVRSGLYGVVFVFTTAAQCRRSSRFDEILVTFVVANAQHYRACIRCSSNFILEKMLTMSRAMHLEEGALNVYETNETDSGCDMEEDRRKPWSHISYWECNRHIGHKWLPVLSSALVVLNDENCQPADDTIWSQQGHLCLDRLVRFFTSQGTMYEDFHLSRRKSCPYSAVNSSPTKQRRRLSHEGIRLLLLPKGQILLTNKTPATPIFVASPCFIQPGDLIASDWPVHRVAPANSLIVFDARIYEDRLTEANTNTSWPGKSFFRPVLHISLGKGWGPAYRRTDFTHCPARLEIWLNLSIIKSHSNQGR